MPTYFSVANKINIIDIMYNFNIAYKCKCHIKILINYNKL